MADKKKNIALLQEKIDNYATLIVTKGVALQPGQELVLSAPVEAFDFVRLVTKKAYEAGAKHVTLMWGDDVISRLTYDNAPLECFETVPEWQAMRSNSLALEGAAFLHIEGSDPSAMKGIDPAKPTAWSIAANKQMVDYRNGIDFGRNAWCIAGAPIPSWAQSVFPDESPEDALFDLWEAILFTARADGEDPAAAWEQHKANFKARTKFMNENHFDQLHYTNAKGTDLYVGMTEKHVWEGGGGELADGRYFFPNMPTEEVFTSPDRARTQGIVYSALPLVLRGSVVDNFWFKFEDGRVVDFGAQTGADVIQALLDTDEGSRYLGEAALVPKESPIHQLGHLFYSTLYDENASCHLALGMGFADCYDGGVDMDKESLLSAGVNDSASHVDFMIGTEDLNIDGIRTDGTIIPVFRDGTWV